MLHTTRGAAALAASAIIVVWLAGPLSQAIADPAWGYGFKLVNNETHRCVDSNASGHAYMLPCSKGWNGYQVWLRHPDAAGWSTWVDFETGLCLDTHRAGDIYTRKCNYGQYQTWRDPWFFAMFRSPSDMWDLFHLSPNSTDNYATHQCLDSNPGDGTQLSKVFTLGCGGGDIRGDYYQQWQWTYLGGWFSHY